MITFKQFVADTAITDTRVVRAVRKSESQKIVVKKAVQEKEQYLQSGGLLQ